MYIQVRLVSISNLLSCQRDDYSIITFLSCNLHFYTIFCDVSPIYYFLWWKNPIQKNNFHSNRYSDLFTHPNNYSVSEICCVCWWYSWHHGFRLFLHSGKGSQRLLFYYLLGLNNDKLYRHVLLHMSTCISNTHTFSLPSTVTHSQYRSNISLALHFIFYPLTPNPCTPYNLQWWWCSCFSTIYNKFEQLRHVLSFCVAVCIIWYYS